MEKLWFWEKLMKFYKTSLHLFSKSRLKPNTTNSRFSELILRTGIYPWIKMEMYPLQWQTSLGQHFLGHKPIFVSIYRIISASPHRRDIAPIYQKCTIIEDCIVLALASACSLCLKLLSQVDHRVSWKYYSLCYVYCNFSSIV